MKNKLKSLTGVKVSSADEIFGYTQEKDVLYFEDSSHKYTMNGEVIPSVTTIIKNAPDTFGFGFPDTIPEFVLKRAGMRGTKVHEYAEHVIDGTLPKDFVKVFKFGKGNVDTTELCCAVDAFLAQNHVEAWSQEDMFHYKKDGKTMYAGTVDFIGTMNGEPVVLDWKTQAVASPIKWAIQLCAYSKMIHQLTGTLIPKGVIVHLMKDGSYEVWEFDMQMTRIWDILVDYYYYCVKGPHSEMSEFIDTLIAVIDDEAIKNSLPDAISFKGDFEKGKQKQ